LAGAAVSRFDADAIQFLFATDASDGGFER